MNGYPLFLILFTVTVFAFALKWSRATALLLFLLLPLSLFAQDGTAPVPAAPGENPLGPLFSLLGGNAGRVVQIITLIGSLRVVFKLFSGHIQAFFERALARVVETSDGGDDHIAAAILANPLYRFFAFLVDMVTSLKLPLVLPTNPANGKVSSSGARVAELLLLCSLSSVLWTGCGTLAPEGAYKGDKLLYAADETIVGAYDALHTFVKWEFQNRAALADKPEITAAADGIRAGAQKWITSAIALRDVYAAQPSAENESQLSTALAVLKEALGQAASYMADFKQPDRPKKPKPAKPVAATNAWNELDGTGFTQAEVELMAAAVVRLRAGGNVQRSTFNVQRSTFNVQSGATAPAN
jgi:hypothetical protein